MASGPDEKSWSARYAEWLLRRRFPLLLASLAVLGVCLVGIGRLQFNDNYRVFFDDSNPKLQALNELEGKYAREEVILFVLKPRSGDVFTPETLDAVESLTEAAWQIPFCTRVDSITSFQHTYADGDDIVVEDLVTGAASLSGEELAEISHVAQNEPTLVGRLISEDGETTAVAATLILPGEHGGERQAPMAKARSLVDQFRERYPNLEIVISGGAVISIAFTEHTFKDQTTLTPLMFVVIFVTTGFVLRSFTATFAQILVILFSVTSAMGLAGWFGLEMTAPSAAMPIIVMTLAVADGIHILTRMMEEMRIGHSKRDALIESLRVNFSPVFVTSITTIVGFLSMNLSPVPPLRDFGNMTAMGVALAFFYSIVFLPAAISFLPVPVRQKEAAAAGGLERLADFVIARRRPLLIGSVIVAILLAAQIPRNSFTNEWLSWFDEETQFRKDAQFVTDNLSGINAIEFSLAAAQPGGITNPDYLRRLDAFAKWVRQQDHVYHASTLADVVKRLNMNMHGDDPAQYCIPQDQQLASQYLLLYEMSLPYGQDLNNQIDVSKSASRVMIITDQLDSDRMHELSLSMEDWLRDNTPNHMHAEATGNGPMFASIAESTIRGMVLGTPVALFVVSLTLILALRSVRYGLISMIPNLAPIIMAFGIWGLTVGKIDFGVAAVASQSIGIVVDDTVHFLSKYLRARREYSYGPEDAIRYAFRSVGRAIGYTSVILVLGFLVLTLSDFRFNSNMGLLTAIAIGCAILCDLLILPPLLLFFDRRSQEQPAAGDIAA